MKSQLNLTEGTSVDSTVTTDRASRGVWLVKGKNIIDSNINLYNWILF